jgi:pteridine reductase
MSSKAPTSSKAVLITGGAKRVGAALVRHFAANGYDIALHYNRSEKDAGKLHSEIEEAGGWCELFPHDLSDNKGIPALMKNVKKIMPHCVALINNASIFEPATLMETNEALFDRQFGINFKAPFFATQAFAKTFGKGAVVNILDTAITDTQGSHFAYLLSKKTLAEFTRMAARELGPKIRVNAVAPGCMIAIDANDTSYEDKMRKLIPLRKHPSLDELGQTVRWLAEQAHITGQLVFVDGGQHAL